MPRYQSDPERRAVLGAIMSETARAAELQRENRWATYLIRDPRCKDRRGNAGLPIYVGQTSDLANRVLSRFMKSESAASESRGDRIERRIADLLHEGVVAKYEVLEYTPTRLTSLVSETNWARKCWDAGYKLANRAELQDSGGPPIAAKDIPKTWLAQFTLAEAVADRLQAIIRCTCGKMVRLPLAVLTGRAASTATLRQISDAWRSTECTFCGATGGRRVQFHVEGETS